MADHKSLSDLNERLAFLGLDPEARKQLSAMQDDVKASIGPSLDGFYSVIAKNPKMAAFFSNPDHMNWAKKRQSEHWAKVASASFDESYVDGVTAVGNAHARIGLEPRWYIGGYALLVENMLAHVVKARWPSRFSKNGAETVSREVSLLVKAALLDMDYSITVYLEQLEAQRQAAEACRLKTEAEQEAAIAALGAALEKLAAGDLESRMADDLPGKFKAMAVSFNNSSETLRETIGKVLTAAEQILGSVGQIANAAENLSQRTEQQAAGVEESSAALHELTESVANSAAGARAASLVVSETLDVAQASGSVVTNAVKAMGEIEGSSSDISKIIGVIDEIAFQTNLLALNAGVEAARAGDAGRGFAVVAQEVRELAQRSASAAREIKGIISTSSGQVGTGVQLVNKSGESLEAIIGKVSELNKIVSDISTAATEQSGGLREISQAIAAMDTITQQNATMVDQTSTNARDLNAMIEDLTQSLRGFKTGNPMRLRTTNNRALEYPSANRSGPRKSVA